MRAWANPASRSTRSGSRSSSAPASGRGHAARPGRPAGGPRSAQGLPATVPMLMPNGPAAWVGLEFKAKASVHSPVSACASGAEALAWAVRLLRGGRGRRRDRGRGRGLHHRHHRRRVRAGRHPVAAQRRARARLAAIRRGARRVRARRGRGHHDPGAGRARRRPRRHGARAAWRATASPPTPTTSPGPIPRAAGRSRRCSKAVADAGLTATDIVHVNCHATSTVAGDPGEAKAVQQALGGHVMLPAPKSSLGHTVGAAGAVEGIVTLLSIRDRVLPATLDLENWTSVELNVVASERPQDRDRRRASATRSGSAGTTWRSRSPGHEPAARAVSDPRRPAGPTLGPPT